MNAPKIYGGKEIKKLARNLPETAPVVGDDDYKKLKRKLNNHFLPKKNKHHARYKQKQIAGESVVTYQCRSKGNISGGARERRRRDPLGGSGGMLPHTILKSRGLEMLFPAFCKSYF